MSTPFPPTFAYGTRVLWTDDNGQQRQGLATTTNYFDTWVFVHDEEIGVVVGASRWVEVSKVTLLEPTLRQLASDGDAVLEAYRETVEA